MHEPLLILEFKNAEVSPLIPGYFLRLFIFTFIYFLCCSCWSVRLSVEAKHWFVESLHWFNAQVSFWKAHQKQFYLFSTLGSCGQFKVPVWTVPQLIISIYFDTCGKNIENHVKTQEHITEITSQFDLYSRILTYNCLNQCHYHYFINFIHCYFGNSAVK